LYYKESRQAVAIAREMAKTSEIMCNRSQGGKAQVYPTRFFWQYLHDFQALQGEKTFYRKDP
jgi:hypothetical protein